MQLAALTLALSVLWPQPRQAELVPDVRLRLPIQVVASGDLDKQSGLMRREIGELFGPEAVGQGVTVVRLQLAPPLI